LKSLSCFFYANSIDMNRNMKNIVLTGFRATGKTSVGRTLAAQLKWAFLDTDVLLCQRRVRMKAMPGVLQVL